MGEAARHFGVDLESRGPEGTAITSGTRTPIPGTGAAAWADGRGWNPEELLLSALGLCLLRTFETLARRERLHVMRCRTRVEATLSPTPYGPNVKLGFTLLTAHIEVAVPPDQVPRARDLVIEAKQLCVVANALMPPVHLELLVEAAMPEVAAPARF
jgi:organic hydroperoxide reductase OsmC/OhrA